MAEQQIEFVDHVNEQIVQAVIAILSEHTTYVSALGDTTYTVLDGQVHELQDYELPVLLIDQGDEDVEPIEIGENPTLHRRLEVLVVIKVHQNADYRKHVNAIRVHVEALLGANRTLNDTCDSIVPTQCTIDLAGDGDAPIASATMRFMVDATSVFGSVADELIVDVAVAE